MKHISQHFHGQNLWTDENPLYRQQWFIINIWAGICGDNLFGPHVLPERLTGWTYRASLGTNMPYCLAIVPLIIR
jgi:hypothetical protein